MTIVKLRRLPETVEAIQWTGSNAAEVVEFANSHTRFVDGVLHLQNYDNSLSPVEIGNWLVRKEDNPGGMVVSYPESILLMLFEREEEKVKEEKPKKSRLRDHLMGLAVE